MRLSKLRKSLNISRRELAWLVCGLLLGWIIPGLFILGLGKLLAKLPSLFLGQFTAVLLLIVAVLLAAFLNTLDTARQAKRFIHNHHGELDLDAEDELDADFDEECNEMEKS